MGTSDGSIIATIITVHMPRNDAAAMGHVCPGMRIHAIDIAHPPGIGIIADIDAHQTIVTAALAANSSAEAPSRAPGRPRPRSTLAAVLVMAAPPEPLLVASQGRAVAP